MHVGTGVGTHVHIPRVSSGYATKGAIKMSTKFLVIRVPELPSSIRYTPDSPEVRVAVKCVEKLLQDLSNSTWAEQWSVARKDLNGYLPDMVKTIAKVLKEGEPS